ncbi:helix-turn-helix transcriptional regulator [Curvibacter gracilis]|uniref:helix-turn-helix transcriptional regulator n=1 Tax=Curvibacter gracilis TaxID=230310 RepID=UPI00048402F1|nr:helix-turn-helix transcriptional regulator [Curvibacter gracilis]
MQHIEEIELISSTIGSAYEAILREDSWVGVLSNLTQLAKADSGSYVLIDESAPKIVQSKNLDLSVLDSYNKDYAAFDPFHGEIMRNSAKNVVHDRSEVDNDFIRNSVWFQEFYRLNRIHSIIALPLHNETGLAGSFNIQRVAGRKNFSDHEIRLINCLAPHFNRAHQIMQKIKVMRQEVMIESMSLDAVTTPILLIDEKSHVILASQAAQQIIRHESILKLEKNHLWASSNSGFISLKFSSRPFEKSLNRGNDRKPLRVISLPLAPDSEFNKVFQRPLCMLILDDPEIIPASLNELLTELFKLTLSEARVCVALGSEGLTPQECSDVFGVSITTIRTQIRSIYNKMGLRRQADLVRLISLLHLTRSKN